MELTQVPLQLLCFHSLCLNSDMSGSSDSNGFALKCMNAMKHQLMLIVENASFSNNVAMFKSNQIFIFHAHSYLLTNRKSLKMSSFDTSLCSRLLMNDKLG